MSGSGKGGDNWETRRKSSKRRNRENRRNANHDFPRGEKTVETAKTREIKFEKKRDAPVDRPRWSPPKMSDKPLPVADCAWCGKPIKDMSSAIADRDNGKPVHFDCVIARIGASEILEHGDAVSYIGGGRFGIVHFSNPPDTRDFKIKKIFEWEDKDNREEWRRTIGDHFSVT